MVIFIVRSNFLNVNLFWLIRQSVGIVALCIVLALSACGGGGGGGGNNTTAPRDSIPNAFTFTDQTTVNPNILITSDSITIMGINTAASIIVAGGEYAINGGAFTTLNGIIQNMQTVVVRQTSSTNTLTATNVTLTIGGVSDTFTVKTRDNIPPQAVSQSHDVYAGSYVLRQATANDPDNEPLFFELLTNVDTLNGALTFSSNGTFIFRPNADYTVGDSQINYRASDAFGASVSSSVTFNIREALPGAILDLRANGLTLETLAATWSTPVPFAPDYDIRYSDQVLTEDNWSQATIFEHSITPAPAGERADFLADNLEQDTAYYFAIRAVNAQDELGPISNVLYAKTVPTPFASINTSNVGPLSVEQNQGGQQSFSISNDGLLDLHFDLEILVVDTPPSWVTSNGINLYAGVLAPGQTQNIPLEFAANVPPGDLYASAFLRHNSLYQDTVEVPLFFQVTDDVTPPPAVSTLGASSPNFDAVRLTWQAVGDAGIVAPPLAFYEIRYSLTPIDEGNWNSTIPAASEPGAVADSEQYFSVTGLTMETLYYFAIKGLDWEDNISTLSNVIPIRTLGPPVVEIPIDSIAMELREGVTNSAPIAIIDTGESALIYSIYFREVEQTNASFAEKQKAASQFSQFSQFSQLSQSRKPRVISELPERGSYAPNELIVRFKPQAEANSLQSLLHLQYDALLINRIDSLNMQVWRINDESTLLETVQRMSQRPDVVFAEPNYAVIANEIPDDALFTSLWGLNNMGQTGGTIDADIDAVEAWNISTGSSDVVVAVIDTGIDYTHPDLVENMWINGDEIAGNGIDDDSNGYVDDVYGYDFANNDGDPFDDSNHGTHVAGTIGATGNNGLGVVGVNHQVALMGVKFLGSNGSGSISAATEGIVYAADNGALIHNNSWGGGGFSESLRAAIEYAHQKDVLFLAAAGNSGTNNDISPSYPSSYEVDNVVSVAATDHNDQLATFSQYGAQSVDLGAPGVDILSSVPGGAYSSFSGTSMATPQVSGAAALLKAHAPNLSNLKIKQILFDSTDPLPDLEPRTVTGGRLNAFEALKLSGPQWIALPPELLSGTVASGETLELFLTIDPTDLVSGIHVGEIVIQTNDFVTPEVTILVTLTVLPDIEAPAPITDLAVTDITESRARLNFTATGDDGSQGQARQYDVRFSTSSDLNESNWGNATSASGLVMPAEAGTPESFVVSSLLANSELWIGVRAIDNAGFTSGLSNVVQVTTLNAELQIIPEAIPPTVSSPGETHDIVLSLRNIGQVDLSIMATVSLYNASSTLASTQHLASRDITKGGIDYRVGPPVTRGSGGPDEFGYAWMDSNESGAPGFTWTDISTTGTLIDGFSDDVVVGPIDIAFPFPFYGLNQNQLFISSNGFITFDSGPYSGCCVGQPIPAADTNNHLIAWMWRDLNPQAGTVHYEHIDNDNIVIQFTNYGEYNGLGTVDAQVQLKASGEMILRYSKFEGNMNNDAVSIGIESQAGDDGLQVAFNTPYLEDGLAITFMPYWLRLDTNDLILSPNAEEQITLTIDTQNLAVGDYDSFLIIQSNDITRPRIALPVNLQVVP